MINEIGGEELLEHFKVPTALNLFSVPTNDSDSGVRRHSFAPCSCFFVLVCVASCLAMIVARAVRVLLPLCELLALLPASGTFALRNARGPSGAFPPRAPSRWNPCL